MRVIEGRVISSFGQVTYPIQRTYNIHQGIDIEADEGTKTYSPTDGFVASVYTHVASGVTIIIGSECRKMRFAMSHLNRVVIKEGDLIKAGQLVAYSGNSGRSTGAHLHFSAKSGGRWYADQYIGGAFVDPTPYLSF